MKKIKKNFSALNVVFYHRKKNRKYKIERNITYLDAKIAFKVLENEGYEYFEGHYVISEGIEFSASAILHNNSDMVFINKNNGDIAKASYTYLSDKVFGENNVLIPVLFFESDNETKEPTEQINIKSEKPNKKKKKKKDKNDNKKHKDKNDNKKHKDKKKKKKK